MRKSLDDIASHARAALERADHGPIAIRASQDCSWLEAVGYPGLKLLAEALSDKVQSADLHPDALGLDLQHVSCVFIADRVQDLTQQKGRLFLRNVRHGLYLVPHSVLQNYGIGCPIDPGFALGGERSKNPYPPKLEAAARDGVEVDDAIWQSLA